MVRGSMSILAMHLLLQTLFIQYLTAQTHPLPVIDMHLHALHADDQGPAPISVDAPFRDLGINDPKYDYRKTFMRALKTNEWADHFITFPTTDDSLRNLTLAALSRNNVYAVTSGAIDVVREWKLAEPNRIINSLDWNFGLAAKYGLTPDSLEKLFKKGEFKVFGPPGAICYLIPRKEFYYYLERLVNAGFGKRIMFGSDNMVWPQAIELGIEAINKASFLSTIQKRDILFNNAARFLRLTEKQIREMHKSD